MSSETFMFVLIIYSVACGCYCAELGSQKNQSGTAWFFGGLFLGIIALIAAAGLPMKEKKVQ